MDATIATQMTPKGLLIPRAALQEWTQTEWEAIKTGSGILIRPKAPSLERESALDMQILEEAGLLLPIELPSVPIPPISAERRAELAHKFSIGKPLSEIIIEERQDRV